MPRRPANVTQADVARTIRAAKQSGAFGVEVRPDGTIFVHLSPSLTDTTLKSDDLDRELAEFERQHAT